MPKKVKIRLLIEHNNHIYCINLEQKLGIKAKSDRLLGIDKGYTEVFVDSYGHHYGEGLGQILSKQSDKLKKKYQARNKLRAIANQKSHKKPNIIKNNFGRKKLNRQNEKGADTLGRRSV